MKPAERLAFAERPERRFALAMAAPGVLVLIVTTTFPLLYLIWQSLHNINLAMPGMDRFMGLENYERMWADERFWAAFGFTLIYTGSTVAMQLVIGLAMALLILRIPRAQWVFRIAAILPIVLAPVVVGLFWRSLMLTPDFGIVDFASRSLGLGSHNWLGDPVLARVSVIVIHTWQWTPFVFLYMLAAIAALPSDLFEAARIDRANAWRRFRYITLPLLWPGIFSAGIFAFLLSWGNFYLTYSLAGSTRTLPTFVFSGIATGSSPLYPAIATVVFIPGILLVILADRMRRKG